MSHNVRHFSLHRSSLLGGGGRLHLGEGVVADQRGLPGVGLGGAGGQQPLGVDPRLGAADVLAAPRGRGVGVPFIFLILDYLSLGSGKNVTLEIKNS